MPLVRLEVRQGRSATQKQALLDAAHAALVEALGIPDHDRMQRIVEHARDDLELPPGSSDDFVLVEVTMFAGRSRQAKRRLYQALVRQLRRAGNRFRRCRRRAAGATHGQLGYPWGQMASEVDLGFEVQV